MRRCALVAASISVMPEDVSARPIAHVTGPASSSNETAWSSSSKRSAQMAALRAWWRAGARRARPGRSERARPPRAGRAQRRDAEAQYLAAGRGTMAGVHPAQAIHVEHRDGQRLAGAGAAQLLPGQEGPGSRRRLGVRPAGPPDNHRPSGRDPEITPSAHRRAAEGRARPSGERGRPRGDTRAPRPAETGP